MDNLRSSLFYQRLLQVVGCVSELILFFAGYYVGKGQFITAFILVILRILGKLAISELMYLRLIACNREENTRAMGNGNNNVHT